MAPVLTYNWILIVAAVVPALALMVKVYKADKLEKEDPRLLFSLIVAGVISTCIALVEEKIGSAILDVLVSYESGLYNIVLYFVIVAFAEETSKYLLLKSKTWKSREFNCQFDGVVYSVFVSLGFALWENISYVLNYGFTTAIVRAVTAIPGHACFGVFMGLFYGQARRFAYLEQKSKAAACRVIAVVVAALLHGSYDYIASMESSNGSLYFIVFVVIMFALAWIAVSRASKNDKYIDRHYSNYEILF